MSEYGIIGDQFGTELPETVVPEQDLSIEKNAARFSKTKEFKALKKHLEERITFYQTYLPDGRSITGDVSVEDWKVANSIIAEFKAVLDFYERSREVVEDAARG